MRNLILSLALSLFLLTGIVSVVSSYDYNRAVYTTDDGDSRIYDSKSIQTDYSYMTGYYYKDYTTRVCLTCPTVKVIPAHRKAPETVYIQKEADIVCDSCVVSRTIPIYKKTPEVRYTLTEKGYCPPYY